MTTWMLLSLAPKTVYQSDVPIISQGLLCDEHGLCETPVNLPYYRQADLDQPVSRMHLRAQVRTDIFENGLPAILLRQFSDRAEIRLNGQLITPDINRTWRSWNQHIYATSPRSTLDGDTATIDIFLTAQPGTRLGLDPFEVGPGEALFFTEQTVQLQRVGRPRVFLGCIVLFAILFPLVWTAQRSDSVFLWLGLACMAATPLSFHWGVRYDPLPLLQWATFWSFCIGLAGYFTWRFAYSFVKRPANRLGGLYLICLSAVGIASFVLPMQGAIWAIHILQLLPILLCVHATSLLLQPSTSRAVTYRIPLFLMMKITLSTAFLVWVDFTFTPSPIDTSYATFGSSCVLLAITWIIFGELFSTSRNYQNLTEDLRRRIDKRTTQLRETYAKLAESDRRRTLEEERQRIMLDLHDGVGGQLANTLAYMSNASGDHDPILRDALEDALRDLALTIDSMETTESVSTLLGMLRGRLEPLLDERGLQFNWQIEAEPKLDLDGPSQNLNLMRLVQEAITNAVKHANAQVITVRLTEDRLRIIDDGDGFDDTAQPTRRGLNGGYGILGMRRRAEQLGGQLQITSTANGTSIALIFPNPPNSSDEHVPPNLTPSG